MNILHFIYDDMKNPWYGGGASLRTHEIYKRMEKRHNITVVTGKYPGTNNVEYVDGIKYVRVGLDKNPYISVFTYSSTVFLTSGMNYYDIIIKDLIPFAPTFTLGGHKVPHIFVIQNIEYQFFRNMGLLGFMPWIVEKLSFLRSKNFIVTSNSLVPLLRKKVGIGSNICVIPYGVDEELFNVSGSEQGYILFLGRLDIYQKGLDILLQAFQEVVKVLPDIKLVIAGSGRQEKKFEQMVANNPAREKIELVGRVIGQRKKDFLKNCLFVCMPSRFESWGIVALEAGACGKAVVGTQINGLSEAIRQNETGVLVPKESPDALAEAIINLAVDKDKRIKLGKKGRIWAKNFNWDIIARKQEKFYEDILNGYGAGAN